MSPSLETIKRNGKPERVLFIPWEVDERVIKAAARRIRRNNALAPRQQSARTPPCPAGAAVSFLAQALADGPTVKASKRN